MLVNIICPDCSKEDEILNSKFLTQRSFLNALCANNNSHPRVEFHLHKSTLAHKKQFLFSCVICFCCVPDQR